MARSHTPQRPPVYTTVKVRDDQLTELQHIEAETGLKRTVLIDRLLRHAKRNLSELLLPESSVPAA